MQPLEGAVIAAAGLGSRLGLGLPKCMLEIEGRTILSRLISQLESRIDCIHVVVGYREDLIIDHCARLHRNVVLVRNPDFRSTNTAQSMALGARSFGGKILFLDGDLLISSRSLDAFQDAAASADVLVGLTQPNSENGVFADTAATGNPAVALVNGFSRTTQHAFEWANIFAGPARLLDDADGYVYEELARRVPLQGQVLQVAEVDTPADLEGARQFGRQLGQ